MTTDNLIPAIRVTASFTAEPVSASLNFWRKKARQNLRIEFSAYNQVFQELLAGPATRNSTTFSHHIFLLRPEDFLGDSGNLDELVDAFSQFAENAASPTTVLFCPFEGRNAAVESEIERAINAIHSMQGVEAFSETDVSARYPVASVFDTRADEAGHIPYSGGYFAAMGTFLARRISAHLRPPAKVLVLDADNTLWGGIAGEDGPGGLQMDGPWKSLREFALTKHSEGLLLCLASKNNASDVDRVFDERADELLLTKEHFAGWKANWETKSSNILALADELNLGLDSFVFLDDNPAEVAEVTTGCPGVCSIALPENPDEIPEFLDHLWCLDSKSGTTAEDTKRTEFYREESQRRSMRDSSHSFMEFLRNLDLDIQIQPLEEEDQARVIQLSQRTNQFNASGVRLNENDIRKNSETRHQYLTVRVSDRFGDYGLVGVIRFEEFGESIEVGMFLLSCRALGKGVERAMIRELGKRALETGRNEVRISFTDTDRNTPCRKFLEEIRAVRNNGFFTLSASGAAELSPFPDEAGEAVSTKESSSKDLTEAATLDGEFYRNIATQYRSPEHLFELIQSEKTERPDISESFVRPESSLQKAIAEIWQDALGIEAVGINDNFSELGGSSIQIVEVHTQILQQLGVEIDIPELFTLPTIRSQEKRILEKEKATATPATSLSGPDLPGDASDDAVAIIGMSLRVPGADTPDQFWENLASGVDSISHFDRDELAYPEEYDLPDFVPAKGILPDIDKFDASFFGILPKDAEIMDPQQRVFLELAWEALERAGYSVDDPGRVGVYAGAYFDTYLLANLATDREFLTNLIPQIQVGSLQTELGNDKDYLATRVAFKLNLRGPAVTLQTACSTSMVAIAEATRSIRDGLCDMALAGGVTITLPYKRGYFYTEQGMLSKDGKCRAFDEQASGTVFANGGGVIVLKRLSDAIRDRDNIQAVIRGTGMNNDGGVKHSYTAPSVDGQVEVIRMAHRDAGVHPDTITSIEGHGTATPLGDPIEVSALTKAFRTGGATENQYCAIGSLKTNVGHLDVASGVCGVIKTALSLEKKQLPPLLHFQKPNPKIDFANSPFFPNDKLRSWEPLTDTPLRAGVSSFGVGGTNVHTILEEAPEITSEPSARANQLFLLSAKTESALKNSVSNFADYASRAKETAADAAYTLAVGRKSFRHRRAVVAKDLQELQSILTGPHSGISSEPGRDNPPVNFLFPGQGAQHTGMARSIYESEPVFRDTLDNCSRLLEPEIGQKLTDALFPDESAHADASELLKHTPIAQPAIFAIEYALAELWKSWEVSPTAMIGHSVGEFAAACQAGVFTLEEGLRILAARGRLMGQLPGGAMLSVRLSRDELLSLLPDTLDLAAVNGPELCVVAGPHPETDAFLKELEKEEIPAKLLHTSHAFHSRMMDPVVGKFASCFEGIDLSAPKIPILSTVTGEWLTEKETTDPLYWAKHLRETVQFSRAVKKLGEKEEEQVFLEVGPGQTLASLAGQILDRSHRHTIAASCAHATDQTEDQKRIIEAAGTLWTRGVELDWKAFYQHETRKRIPLPTYPFEKKSHWFEPNPVTSPTQQGPVTDSTLLHPAPEAAPATLPVETPAPAQTAPMNGNPSRIESIGTAIRETLTDLSGIPPEDLPGTASFLELGFDSLLLTQVSKAFQNSFGTEVTMRQLMSGLSSIDALAAHLDEELPADRFEAVAEAPAVAPVQQAPSLPAPAPAVASVTPSAPAVPTVPANGDFLQQMVALQQQQINLLTQHIAGGTASLPQPVAASQPAAPPSPVSKPGSSTSKPAPSSAPTTSIQTEVDDTLTPTQRAHIENLVARYTAKTGSSKELTETHREWYADPRTVSGFNPLWKEMIYQIVVEKSKGSRLLDIDGNEYIDILNGFGPNFLGHSPDFVTDALHRQLDRGVEVGPQSRDAMETAKLFCEITGNERASFVNTGSEAVQAAMRLSRTVTGRDKIVVFEKDYHGNFDEVLVKGVGAGDKLRSLPIAPGIPRRAVEDVIVLPYGTDESLQIIRERAHELAAVIIEPIQSRRPEFQPHDFVREVRQITSESGSVFVFDEVITGFRTGPRGAQEYFGVEADIATYGKVVGGGMPIGVVAGKAEYMDTFDGGTWQYGDDSVPEKGVTFFAGTFVRHPLAMAAVKEVLLHLREKGPEFWDSVKAKANRLAQTVDQLFVENEVPFRMPNFGSQMFVRLTDPNHKYANLLFFHLREKGVFLLEGFPTYMTAAHTDEDIDYVIDAFRESVAEMQKAGFFPSPPQAVGNSLNGSRLSGPAPVLTNRSSSSEPVEPTRDIIPLTEPLAEVYLASSVDSTASLCFNEIVVLRLTGSLDIESLHKSLREVARRHEALRSVFPAGGDGFRILPEIGIDLPVIDISSENDPEAAFQEHLTKERATVFNLEEGPLFHGLLFRQEDQDHQLLLNAHHLVCDGSSFNEVIADLSRFYNANVRGEKPALTAAPSFSEYARRTRHHELASAGSRSEQYWLKKFSESVPDLSLPLDGTRPENPDYRVAAIREDLSAEFVQELRKTAGASGATLFAILVGTFQTLLARICRQDRILTMFPTAGQSLPGNEGVVGHCVNFLPLVGVLDDKKSFAEHIGDTQGELLDALEHQDFTFGQLLQALPSKDRPRADVAFTLERMDGYEEFTGLETVADDPHRDFGINPLFFNAIESEDGIALNFAFQTTLFKEETIREWLSLYIEMLKRGVASPDLSIAELKTTLTKQQSESLHRWNDTGTDYPKENGIGVLFEETAQAHADRRAVTTRNSRLSYGDLSIRVDDIAHALVKAGAAPGKLVGLFLERSIDSIAGAIAILKTGAAYVPLDPEYPAERLALMLEDSNADLILTSSVIRHRLPQENRSILEVEFVKQTGKTFPSNTDVTGESPACILYTSGSTGIPKGAIIPHRAVSRLVRNTNYCKLSAEETFLHAASICFDASLFEFFGPLLNGGTLAIPPKGPLSLDTISRTIRDEGVTTLWLTSGLFQLMVDEEIEAFSGIRQLIAGGDIVPVDHADRLLRRHPDIHLFNGYGPTESTTFVTAHRVKPSDLNEKALPIGKPVSNSTVHILDAEGNQLPPGIPGELWCGGDGVALSYLNRNDLTQERFQDDPFTESSGAKIYRTGDLCRWRSDGVVEFIGRMDHQVKIRGYRVEPGEIEVLLSSHRDVNQCKVIVEEDAPGQKSLVAFVTPFNGSRPAPENLQNFLRAKLPDYMVPRKCIVVSEMPMNSNGKIDPLALSSKTKSESAESEKRELTETEATLTKHWEDVLRVSPVSLDDDFFALGGHSLLGMKLFSRYQKATGVSLPLSVLFQNPTIRQLALAIEKRDARPGTGERNNPIVENHGYHDTSEETQPAEEVAPSISESTILLHSGGPEAPLFGVHGGDGGIFFYRNLSDHIDHDRAFYAFEASVLTNGGAIPVEPIEETAARYIRELNQVHPGGPVNLCGYSFGGLVAFEMAVQLQKAGREIQFVGLIDTDNPAQNARKLSIPERVAANWNQRSSEDASVLEKFGKLSKRFSTGLGYSLRFRTEGTVGKVMPTAKNTGWLRQIQVRQAYEQAMDNYDPGKFEGDISLFRATEGNDKFDLGEDYGWSTVVSGNVNPVDVPGNHISLFHKANIGGIAKALQNAINGAAQKV